MDREQALQEVDFYTHEISRINRNQISEIKAFNAPPELVKVTMEAVCLLFGQKEDWKSSK